MASQIQCECGYVARDQSEDTVVALIEEHLRIDHPDLARTVDEDIIRSWVEIVD